MTKLSFRRFASAAHAAAANPHIPWRAAIRLQKPAPVPRNSSSRADGLWDGKPPEPIVPAHPSVCLPSRSQDRL